MMPFLGIASRQKNTLQCHLHLSVSGQSALLLLPLSLFTTTSASEQVRRVDMLAIFT